MRNYARVTASMVSSFLWLIILLICFVSSVLMIVQFLWLHVFICNVLRSLGWPLLVCLFNVCLHQVCLKMLYVLRVIFPWGSVRSILCNSLSSANRSFAHIARKHLLKYNFNSIFNCPHVCIMRWYFTNLLVRWGRI